MSTTKSKAQKREWSADAVDALVLRGVTFTVTRSNLAGSYAACVRGGEARGGELRTLQVQLAAGAGKTFSARYRGQLVRLEREELKNVRVHVRGRKLTLDECLEKFEGGEL